MNENIKAMCLKIAELSLGTKDVYISIIDFAIMINHYNYEDGSVSSIYYDDIHFIERDAEERIKKALDHVRNLGGNKDV